jgi:hypothetical protein
MHLYACIHDHKSFYNIAFIESLSVEVGDVADMSKIVASNNINRLDEKRDWLHKVCSEVFQLEDESLRIESRLHGCDLLQDDIDEILSFVKNMSKAQQSELSKYAISSRIAVIENGQQSIFNANTVLNRKNRKDRYFKSKVSAFSV